MRARIGERVALNLQIAQRKNQVPIGALHAGYHFDGSLAKLGVGQREILFRDLDLPARQIEPEPARQWLRETESQRRWILRIQGRELAVAGLPNRGKVDPINAAELRRQAF